VRADGPSTVSAMIDLVRTENAALRIVEPEGAA
jgi:hypothetical protein